MKNPILGSERQLVKHFENIKALVKEHEEEGDMNLTKGKKSRDIRNMESEEREVMID